MLQSFQPRRGQLSLAAALLATAACLVLVPAASASTVIVQGTTDIRDAGLLEEVIEPGFHAAYPQYSMKYVPVGTGQALTNARAGQGDAVVTHAPTLEKTFVEEGYSLEPRGRAIFYSDYVIPGPLADPAGVLAGAPHNAAHAYQLVAEAGAKGEANFVSRGDGSGTNTQEKAIWKLTKVELNELGEPGPAGTKTDASWYHKGGGGQAETVLLTQQCPFTGGACYEMTDRGTFNRLLANGSVTELKVLADRNEAGAPGGANLLTNPFTVYAVNPAKVPNVNINVDGAKALLEYLTSAAFQARLASFPNSSSPAFFADAHPKLSAGPVFSGTVAAEAPITVSGSASAVLPGAPTLSGQPVLLQRAVFTVPVQAPSYTTIAATTIGADGSYSLSAPATRGGLLRVEMPMTSTTYPPFTATPLIAVGALTQTDVDLGQLSVRSQVQLKAPALRRRVVTLRGLVGPVADRDSGASLLVLGHKQGRRKFRTLRRLYPGKSAHFRAHVKLASGKWKLRVRYRDPGAVLPATSRAVSVSVR